MARRYFEKLLISAAKIFIMERVGCAVAVALTSHPIPAQILLSAPEPLFANFRHFRILKEMTKADIHKLALALPEADQIELAHTLLDNTTPSLTEPQEMEVTRRIKAYRADPSILVSEEDALIRLKQLVAG